MTVETATAVITRDYERLKPEILRTVRGKLASMRVQLDDADLDAAYNQAWHSLYAKLEAGEDVENVNGLLVNIAYRRAIDEYRSQRPDRRADEELLAVVGDDRDFASELDDHIRLREFMEGMRERLDERERTAAALCYLHDYTRPEAAELLGVKPKRMEKIMDEVSKKVAAFVQEIQGDEWCESRRSLIKAYAVGLLDQSGERYKLATDHLHECPACRRRVLAIRGIAAAAPPAPAILALAGVGGGGAAGAGGGHAVAAGGHASHGLKAGLLHAGAGTAKTAGIALASVSVVAASALAVTQIHKHRSERVVPTPTPTVVVAKATPTPPPPVSTPVPAATSAPKPASTPAHKKAAKKKHHKKHKTAHKAAATPVATATAVPTPIPTAVATAAPPAATVVPTATPKPKKVVDDGAQEFDLR